MILIDTNVVSELVKRRPAPEVQGWFARQDPKLLFLSSVTLGEIDLGARSHPDEAARDRLLRWCDELQERMFARRILALDAAAARAWGRIAHEARARGRSLERRDSQIAAIALRFGARLATRNTRHFVGLGLDLIDPFAGTN